MHSLWTAIFYRPLYNALLLGVNFIPGGDVGLAIILLTLIVKLILFPLTQKSVNTQLKMKEIEPLIAEIKEKVTDKTEQNKQIFAIYKEQNVNPFSSCLLVIIQMPIIVALYLVFIHGFASAPGLAYPFVHVPESFNFKFLGFIDLAQKSIVFAILAGLSQFGQGWFAKGRQTKPTGTSMKDEMARSMQTQMLYFMPIMIVFIAYRFAAAVALYWITSNIFTIGQEIYTTRKMKLKKQNVVVSK